MCYPSTEDLHLSFQQLTQKEYLSLFIHSFLMYYNIGSRICFEWSLILSLHERVLKRQRESANIFMRTRTVLTLSVRIAQYDVVNDIVIFIQS